MSRIVGKLIRDEKRKRIIIGCKRKGRQIDQFVYERLKRKTKCDHCGEKLNKIPEIHHKIAISHGGSNKEENLMAVHKKCHEKLDIKQGVRTKEQIKTGQKPKKLKPRPRKK